MAYDDAELPELSQTNLETGHSKDLSGLFSSALKTAPPTVAGCFDCGPLSRLSQESAEVRVGFGLRLPGSELLFCHSLSSVSLEKFVNFSVLTS